MCYFSGSPLGKPGDVFFSESQFPPNNSSTVGFTGSNVQESPVPSDLFVHIFFALSAAFKEQPEAAPAPALRPGKLAYAGDSDIASPRGGARRAAAAAERSSGRLVGRKCSSAALVQTSSRLDDYAAGMYARDGVAGAARAMQGKVVIGAESALVLRVGSHGFSLPFVRCVRNRNSRAILRPQLSS